MTRLAAEGSVREAIVVGVWNTPKRFQEYMPAKAVSESGLPEDWPGHSLDEEVEHRLG